MAQEKIVAGMDLDKLEAFRAALKENPVTLGLEAKAVWEGHSGRSTVTASRLSSNLCVRDLPSE